jgi:cell division protein FtsZ
MSVIHESAADDANIIFGAVLDDRMKDEMKITVIATGFDRPAAVAHEDPSKFRTVAGPGAQRRETMPLQHEPTRDLSVPTFLRKKAD